MNLCFMMNSWVYDEFMMNSNKWSNYELLLFIKKLNNNKVVQTFLLFYLLETGFNVYI